jgi:predicted permease
MDLPLDVRYAWRLVVRHRVISACAIMSIAVCTAAAALCLGFIDAAEHARLPYADPEHLVHLVSGPILGAGRAPPDLVNRTLPLDLAQSVTSGSRTLQEIALMLMPEAGTIAGRSEASNVVVRGVSPTMFAVLGRAPSVGRTFAMEDGGANQPRVAVLSQSGWRTKFGGDSTVIGKAIVCRSVVYTVIGVMPIGIEGDEKVDAWVPIDQIRASSAARSAGDATMPVWVVGRMAPTASLRDVQAEVGLRLRVLGPSLPGNKRRYRVDAVSMRSFMYPAFVGRIEWFAYASVGALVLVTVLSLSLLVLARDMRREQDCAIRASLGASVWRVVRPYAIESLMVGGSAACLGVPLAELLYARLGSARVFENSWWIAHTLSVRAIVLAAGLGLGMGLLSLALAAHRAATTDGFGRSPYATGGFSAGTHEASARIVAAEIAFSVMLLSLLGASLFRAVRLARFDFGFEAGRVVQVVAPSAFLNTHSATEWRGLLRELETELQGVPGVKNAGAVQVRSDTALTLAASSGTMRALSTGAGAERLVVAYADSQFFAALRLEPVRGRLIASADDAVGAPVAVLSRRAAALLFPDGNPIGSVTTLQMNDRRIPLVVVGVVGDVNMSPTRYATSPATVYSPAALDSVRPPMVLASGTVEAQELATVVGRSLRRPLGTSALSVYPFSDAFAAWRETQQLPFRALAPVVLVALGASLLALFALVSDAIGRRAHELGIRAALGASPSRNASLVVRSIGGSVGAGLCLGIGMTLLIAPRFAQLAHLGEIPGWMPVTCGLSFVPAAAAAVLRPIIRSANVAPAQLLREL